MIGVGAIGSYAVSALARLGIGIIRVYDGDVLEEHNISNQHSWSDMLGQPKVRCLESIVQKETGLEIQGFATNWNTSCTLADIVVSAVDRLSARKDIWKKMRLNPKASLLIDPRMGAEVGHLFIVNPKDMDQFENYESSLEGEAEELPCSARSIVYCPMVMGGIIADVVKRHICRQWNPQEIIMDLKSFKFWTMPENPPKEEPNGQQ